MSNTGRECFTTEEWCHTAHFRSEIWFSNITLLSVTPACFGPLWRITSSLWSRNTLYHCASTSSPSPRVVLWGCCRSSPAWPWPWSLALWCGCSLRSWRRGLGSPWLPVWNRLGCRSAGVYKHNMIYMCSGVTLHSCTILHSHKNAKNKGLPWTLLSENTTIWAFGVI